MSDINNETDLAKALATFTVGVRQLVARLGPMSAAQVCYRAGDELIAKAHASFKLPPIDTYRKRDAKRS